MYYPLIVEKDVFIELRDSTTLCADVFRPDDTDTFPVIITLGPYPKDIHFKDFSQGRTQSIPAVTSTPICCYR